MPSLSSLPLFSNYYLFRAGINPSWEDPFNQGGGRWVANISEPSRPQQQQLSSTHTQTDAHWMEAVKSVVGAQYGGGNEAVCGVVASLRSKQNKVALWIRNARDLQQRALIGEVFKQKLSGMPRPDSSYDMTRVDFESHDQCLMRSTR